MIEGQLEKGGSSADQNDSAGSDSDITEETHAGNVNNQYVLPNGYTGKARRGMLVFNACFESGNLGKVDHISDFEYDLYIRADTCNPKFRVWFYFSVENTRKDQRVIFNIVNFSKTKSLYREGMSPLVKSTSRPSWFRIPHKNVYYYRCPEHHKNYVMSFAFCFDKESDTYEFCYCYPYTYSMLQSYLDLMDKNEHPHYKRRLLGTTLQNRRLDLITITHPKNMEPKPGAKQRVIFVTARVHPGETPSSYVCQGFIDFMVSSHPVAEELRDNLIFKVVPMLNPDGVYLGNYRCSLMGFDLNRQWQEPSQWAHPTIFATKQLLMKLNQNTAVDVNFFIDIHAHSTLMNGFMYGNVFEDEDRAERQAVFPNLMSRFAEDFSLPQTNFNRDAVKAGTGRRTLGGILDDRTLCYTLEVSFFSYTNAVTNEMMLYTEQKYARLGRNLARTFHEYYSAQGLFRANLISNSIRPVSAERHPLSMGDGIDCDAVSDGMPTNLSHPLAKALQESADRYPMAKGDSTTLHRRVASLDPISQLTDKAMVARALSDRLNSTNDPPDEWKRSLNGVSWRLVTTPTFSRKYSDPPCAVTDLFLEQENGDRSEENMQRDAESSLF
ncbi:ATP/GTP binding protein 4 [Fasciola gigantica]|uniref:ATP/GTP binding protein 4 n=1 Tax=Fasciola gigantica TaxID=46835 RepID=A0A504Z122_FASGI|nr:ATP/GTP binding protein 4 [Fasciola gigantica]